jgi:gluconolactonase
MSEEAAAVDRRQLTKGLRYPEGPAIAPDGTLHVVELGGGEVRRIDSAGTHHVVASLGGSPNGQAITSEGVILVCNNGGRHPPAPSTGGTAGRGGGTPAIQQISATGEVSTLIADIEGAPLNAPNDICLDGEGGIWFSDPSWNFLDDGMAGPGDVCYGTLEGTAARVHRGLRFPNGVALDADGTVLYVAESSTGDVWAFDVEGPGRLGAPRHFGSCGGGALPDGMAVDSDGTLLVAGHGSGNLHVFDAGGHERAPVELGAELGLSNLCFAGDDLRRLVVTAANTGEVLELSWAVPGLPLRG